MSIQLFGITLHADKVEPFEGREYMPGGDRQWKPMGRARVTEHLWASFLGEHKRWRGGGYSGAASDYKQIYVIASVWDLCPHDRREMNKLARDAFARRSQYQIAYYEEWNLSQMYVLHDGYRNDSIPLFVEPYEDVIFPPFKGMLGIREDRFPYLQDQHFPIGEGKTYCWQLWNMTLDDLGASYAEVLDQAELDEARESFNVCRLSSELVDGSRIMRLNRENQMFIAASAINEKGDEVVIIRVFQDHE